MNARNAFNEPNRTAMLWTVRYEWPSGARFTFNCYKHLGTLAIRNNNGSGTFLSSKEGVTQGDPLSMFADGVGLLPFFRPLKKDYPEMVQTWYADDAGLGGKYNAISNSLQSYKKSDYMTAITKSPRRAFLLSHENLAAATAAFKDSEFTITTGNCYLGSFICEKDTRDHWIQEKVACWSEVVKELASVADTYPQSAYAGLQKSMQQ
jgi:hypothetical protein